MAFIAIYLGDAIYAGSTSTNNAIAAVNQIAIVPTTTGNTTPASILTNARANGSVTLTLSNPTGSKISGLQINGESSQTGTNYYSNGTTPVVGSIGTVSTKGVYSITGNGTIVISEGKVSDGHIRSTFVFTDGSGDFGTFDWRLAG